MVSEDASAGLQRGSSCSTSQHGPYSSPSLLCSRATPLGVATAADARAQPITLHY
jgi:hypothetical protein